MDIYQSYLQCQIKMFSKVLLVLLLLHAEFLNSYALMPECPLYQMHFQKIIGVRPQSEFITERNRIYRDLNSISTTVTFDCYQVCKRDPDCIAYVHLLDTNECYGYSLLHRTSHYMEFKSNSFALIGDPNAIFYEKICLKVPDSCNERLWVLTKIPGNSLMLEGKKTIQSLITRRECAEKCLFETEFDCLSASFAPSFRNNQERFNEQLHEHQQNYKTLGRCVLSNKDKTIQPDAFRTAPFDEEYIENQCHTRPIESDHCSYELYADSTFTETCTEAEYIGVSQKKCQSLCSNTIAFYCQGASYFYDGDISNAKCLLHSEDIISMGPRSLSLKKNSVYMRRVKCLDVQVVCTKDEMTVKYTPKDWFRGKIYTSWHSKDCSVKGLGNESISLHLSIGSEYKEKRCGILRAFEVNGTHQRTFISTFVVIQNNPNVQTQGDRLIKVGCIMTGLITLTQDKNDNKEDHSEDMPSAIALESSLEPVKIYPSNYTSGSESVPKITFQIIDLSRRNKTIDVQIGQNLELQIISENTKGNEKSLDPPPPNFRATSLIAKSVETRDYILLIDERGCPTDINVFPAFERIKTDTKNILRARFHAFKFVGSSNVDFNVKIEFCGENCSTDNCQRYNKVRSRRQSENSQLFRIRKPVYFSTIIGEGKSRKYSSTGSKNFELPLTYNLRVHGIDEKNIEKDFYGDIEQFVLIRADDGNLINLCLNQTLMIVLFIFILIIFTTIVFMCCYINKKRKRFKTFDDERR